MTTPYNNELTVLINCMATTFGDEVGAAVQEKFDQVYALHGTDINAITAQIAQLNALLASNTSGDVLTAQSILAQLAALDSRIDVLEGDTRIDSLTTVVTALQQALAGEISARADADAALQSSINSIQTALDSLTSQVTSIINDNSGNTDCDCAALTAAIAEQSTAIANLQAADAAQAIQIAALQTAITNLSSNAAAIAAAQAAADAAALVAQTALATASTATATADAATATAANAQATAASALTLAGNADGAINNVLVEIKNINCAAIGNSFRTAMRGRLFGLNGGNGNGNGN